MYNDNRLVMHYKEHYCIINLKKGIKVADSMPNMLRAFSAAEKKDKKMEILLNAEDIVVLSKVDLEALIQTYATTINSEIKFSVVNTKYPQARQQLEAVNQKIRQHKKANHQPISLYSTLDNYLEEKGYKPTQQNIDLKDLGIDPDIEKLLK